MWLRCVKAISATKKQAMRKNWRKTSPSGRMTWSRGFFNTKGTKRIRRTQRKNKEHEEKWNPFHFYQSLLKSLPFPSVLYTAWLRHRFPEDVREAPPHLRGIYYGDNSVQVVAGLTAPTLVTKFSKDIPWQGYRKINTCLWALYKRRLSMWTRYQKDIGFLSRARFLCLSFLSEAR